MGRHFVLVLAALVLTIASAKIQRSDQEVAVYGNMGTLNDMVNPRLTGGWPAAWIADSPDTSVLNQIGPEDDIRPGAFVANLAFWYLALMSLSALARKVRAL